MRDGVPFLLSADTHRRLAPQIVRDLGGVVTAGVHGSESMRAVIVAERLGEELREMPDERSRVDHAVETLARCLQLAAEEGKISSDGHLCVVGTAAVTYRVEADGRLVKNDDAMRARDYVVQAMRGRPLGECAAEVVASMEQEKATR